MHKSRKRNEYIYGKIIQRWERLDTGTRKTRVQFHQSNMKNAFVDYTIERTHSLSSTRESHRDVVSDRDKQHRGWHLSVLSEVTGGYDDEETLILQENHTCHKVHSATLYLDAQKKGTIRAIHAWTPTRHIERVTGAIRRRQVCLRTLH